MNFLKYLKLSMTLAKALELYIQKKDTYGLIQVFFISSFIKYT